MVKLSLDTAEFRVSGNPVDPENAAAYPLGGNSVRLILVVRNPYELFKNALAAGATMVFPVGEEYGW